MAFRNAKLTLSFESDLKRLEKALPRNAQKYIPALMSSTLNRVAKSTNKVAVQIIGAHLNLKKTDIRNRYLIKVQPANPRRLRARLGAKDINIPLHHYPHSTRFMQGQRNPWTGEPLERVQVKPRRGQKLTTVTRGFKTPRRTYGEQIVQRIGKQRGPLRSLYGPSVYRRFIRRSTIGNLSRHAERRFGPELKNRMRRYKAIRNWMDSRG